MVRAKNKTCLLLLYTQYPFLISNIRYIYDNITVFYKIEKNGKWENNFKKFFVIIITTFACLLGLSENFVIYLGKPELK